MSVGRTRPGPDIRIDPSKTAVRLPSLSTAVVQPEENQELTGGIAIDLFQSNFWSCQMRKVDEVNGFTIYEYDLRFTEDVWNIFRHACSKPLKDVGSAFVLTYPKRGFSVMEDMLARGFLFNRLSSELQEDYWTHETLGASWRHSHFAMPLCELRNSTFKERLANVHIEGAPADESWVYTTGIVASVSSEKYKADAFDVLCKLRAIVESAYSELVAMPPLKAEDKVHGSWTYERAAAAARLARTQSSRGPARMA